MQSVQRAILAARARLFRQALLTSFGAALLAALTLLALLLAADRLMALRLPMVWVALAIAVVTPVVAPLLALRRRPSDKDIAALLDRRLKLNDQLATALYAASLKDDPLASQVVAEANRAAQNAPVAQATPIQFTKRWRWVPAALIALALLIWLLPESDWLGLQARRDAAAAQAAEQRAAEREMEQARQAMRRAQQRRGGESREDEEMSQVTQLSRQDLSTPEGRKQAAAELAEAAERLEQQAERKQREDDAQRNMLSRMEQNAFGPANRFASELRRGDLDAAAESLQDLSDSVDAMTPDQKEKLAEQLNDLSRQLKDEAARQGGKAKQANQQAKDQLQRHGMNEQQAEQLAQPNTSEKTVEDALRQKGADAETSKQVAGEVQEKKQQQQAAEKNERNGQSLSDKLQRMAQAAKQDAQQRPSQNTQQRPGGGQPSKQQADASQQNAKQQPGAQGRPQQNADQSKPGQQPGGSQFAQAAQQAKQQLQQMSQAGKDAQTMRQSAQQSRQAMRQLAKSGSGPPNKSGKQPGNQPGSKAGQSSSRDDSFGMGDNGKRTASQTFTPDKTFAVNDMSEASREKEGKVIAAWDKNGKIAKGEAKVAYDTAVAAAQTDAEQAVAEDRVPKRYHQALQDYFKQLPDEQP